MLIIGHSHLYPLIWANNLLKIPDLNFMNLLDEKNKIKHEVFINKIQIEREKLHFLLAQDKIILYLSGNEHNIVSFSKVFQDASEGQSEEVLFKTMEYFFVQVKFFIRLIDAVSVKLLLPPPPVQFLNDPGAMNLPESFLNYVLDYGLPSDAIRLHNWKKQCGVIEKFTHEMGIGILNFDDYINRNILLSFDESSNDGSHGSIKYGERILNSLIK
jgi:hypothetical protein